MFPCDLFRAFPRCERGSIPIITALCLVPMLVVSGGAVDLVTHERLRAEVQDALDRGVLAAASLSQAQPARKTVLSYLDTISEVSPDEVNVTLDPEKNGLNVRHVEATIETSTKTSFLKLIRIDTLPVVARSVAEERRSNVEVSLLLDISNSMRFDKRNNHFPGLTGDSRINAMRPAAKGFIDSVLAGESKDFTTVSIIPFAGQVSVGPVLFDALSGGHRQHDRSSCFEFTADDFKLGVPNFPALEQTQQFVGYGHPKSLSSAERSIVDPWWCPDEPHDARSEEDEDYIAGEGKDQDDTSISVLSNDPERLKAQIDQYKLYGGTGTQYAMKWGLLLLDPAIQPMLEQAMSIGYLADELKIDPEFKDRPAPFDDEKTLKFIVVMTDGAISDDLRPKDKEDPIQYSPKGNTKLYTKFKKKKGRDFYSNLCRDAKANGVVIFSIGFYVQGGDQKPLRDCASGPDYYYQVDSSTIGDAFQSIATAIQKIKLLS